MAPIMDIEGIGPAYAAKLQSAGISSTDELLDAGATAKGRDELAEKTGIAATQLLTWINHCDLLRIDGVGEQYADLLEAAGVDTVRELAQRNATNLAAKLEEANAAAKRVDRTPSESQVQGWIDHAKTLPRIVQY